MFSPTTKITYIAEESQPSSCPSESPPSPPSKILGDSDRPESPQQQPLYENTRPVKVLEHHSQLSRPKEREERPIPAPRRINESVSPDNLSSGAGASAMASSGAAYAQLERPTDLSEKKREKRRRNQLRSIDEAKDLNSLTSSASSSPNVQARNVNVLPVTSLMQAKQQVADVVQDSTPRSSGEWSLNNTVKADDSLSISLYSLLQSYWLSIKCQV